MLSISRRLSASKLIDAHAYADDSPVPSARESSELAEYKAKWAD